MTTTMYIPTGRGGRYWFMVAGVSWINDERLFMAFRTAADEKWPTSICPRWEHVWSSWQRVHVHRFRGHWSHSDSYSGEEARFVRLLQTFTNVTPWTVESIKRHMVEPAGFKDAWPVEHYGPEINLHPQLPNVTYRKLLNLDGVLSGRYNTDESKP